MELDHIDTEKANPATTRIDEETTEGIVRLINDQDQLVAPAVARVLPQIAQAVDLIYERMSSGGRLVYLGSGTSGRLGVLDAVECPPTFGVTPNMVVGLMAGGSSAYVRAKEGAEDDREAGAEDLKQIQFSAADALVGIAASGRTPYVLGGMAYAASLGAPVIGLTCTQGAALSQFARVTIAPLCGPEVVTGSTRMKSGTAQKMVLNMLSTAVMIKLGKVWGNLMVDVKATNQKLVQRAVNIIKETCGVTEGEAADALQRCGGNCKKAIVCIKCGISNEQAREALDKAGGRIAEALKACGADR
jgi:N-acetylmuramic acid 6-phosphate etherase